MIITVSLNPALDRTLVVDGVNVDGVNRVAGSRVDAGGKSINVSKVIKAFGGETVATGIVGGSTGAFICSQLDEMGIRHDFVKRKELTRTNLKIRDSVRKTITEFNEPGEPVTEDLLQQVWEKINSMAQAGDTVVISGANPPGMADDVLAAWIGHLKQKGVLTALDTVGGPMKLGIAAQPNVIKPNVHELSELLGEPLHYQRDVIAAAREIVQQGVEYVVVSMGADGALFVTKDHIFRAGGVKVPVASTVGAGDAMLAAILYHLQSGCSWEETAKWSIATGAANVMCEGSLVPTADQIAALLDQVRLEQLL